MGRTNERFEVAVFPLSDAVLFPGVTLPVQIHDEAYRAMLKEVEARGIPLAVSLVNEKPGADEELQLNPICGAGQIQRSEATDGSTAERAQEVLIRGDSRVRLLKIIQQEPYLIMEAERVEPENSGMGTVELEEFQALLKTWAFINPDFPDQLAPVFDEFEALGPLTDFFVFHFLKKAPEKQIYLDLISPIRRAERLADFLERDLIRMTRKLMSKRAIRQLH
jgi:Lon protease-like protein